MSEDNGVKKPKLDFSSSETGKQVIEDPNGLVTKGEMQTYVFNAAHIYNTGLHIRDCKVCQGATQMLPETLNSVMAKAINGVLEAFAQGVPVLDENGVPTGHKIVLDQSVLDMILHRKEPSKAPTN